MTKEKKKMIIFTVVLTVVALALIVVLLVSELRSSGTIGSKDSSEIVEKFNEQFESKGKTVIYYASPSCSYCTLQTPILETIAEDYDMDYYYLEIFLLNKR